MADAVALVKAMKRAALEAVEASKPVNIDFGQVVSISPLQISVEQKMVLSEAQLALSRNVTDFRTMITIQWETEEEQQEHTHTVEKVNEDNENETDENENNENVNIISTSQSEKHIHEITGQKEIIIHNALKIGDKVILIRQQEGQKYVVLDRIGVMEIE